MTMFSVFADDRAALRTIIRTEIVNPAEAGLTAAQSSSASLIVNQLVASWMAATQKTAEDVRVTADAKALRLPAMISRTHLIALRKRFETDNGRVPDSIFPCAALLEKRFEEIEEGILTAQPLSEIISVELSVDEHTEIDLGSNVRVRKAPKAIALPNTTEEFRNRMKTLAISFVLASYKHGSRVWLKTATMRCFAEYTDYILSDQVALFHLDQEGVSVHASRQTVLIYEHAMRKATCRSVLYDSLDFETALKAAQRDLNIKERFFISPTAILSANGKRRPAAAIAGVPPIPVISNKRRKAAERVARNKSGSSKGPPSSGSGGKGKGKSKSENPKTPDGRLICGFYNKAAGCKKEGCTWVHVCSRCYQNHPAFECTPR